jgi:hypothetical protein
MKFILAHDLARTRALEAVKQAPAGYYVEVKEATRNLEQNALLWALLNDISEQVEWHGQWLSPEDWKHVFSASLKKQRAVQGIDGGFVVLGQSTSRMGKKEFSDLLELIQAFAIERDVKFSGESYE